MHLQGGMDILMHAQKMPVLCTVLILLHSHVSVLITAGWMGVIGNSLLCMHADTQRGGHRTYHLRLNVLSITFVRGAIICSFT